MSRLASTSNLSRPDDFDRLRGDLDAKLKLLASLVVKNGGGLPNPPAAVETMSKDDLLRWIDESCKKLAGG